MCVNYPIHIKDAEKMLKNICIQPLIEKVRYEVDYKGSIWEIDEFAGEIWGW